MNSDQITSIELPRKLNKPEAQKIQNMFSQVAKRYDVANDMLSIGIHHLWRKSLVKWSEVKLGNKVLDCATGTGDLAIEFKKRVGAQGEVIGTDFCKEMLASAPQKALQNNFMIQFETADVTALPYANKSFDICSISFGIRNVQDPIKALQEMARVTRSSGNVMILEFGQPSIWGLKQAYQFYSEKVLPYIGGLITGQKDAYQYLQNSSAQFPCGADFLKLVEASNAYQKAEYKSLSFGICYAYKLKPKV